MGGVRLNNVNKFFGSVHAVKDFTLDIADQEFVVLVGPSGCGKSTTLRMIAGLEEISSGTIEIGGRVVNHLQPKDRDISMVFQNYALYQHMSVYDNLAFGLRNRKYPDQQIKNAVDYAAKMLRITDLLKRRPRQLSGGQQQRVALGRCIVRNPQVFLFDEPLSNLDAKLRAQMRAELKRLRQRVPTTSIYVTHDQLEAMTLGDRLVVMKDGYIRQVGTALEVYSRPKDLFVAGFIGSPAMNFVNVTLVVTENAVFGEADGLRIKAPTSLKDALYPYINRTVFMGVRPEHLQLCSSGEPHQFEATVDVMEQLGSELLLSVTVGVAIVLVSRVEATLGARVGEKLCLAADSEKLHFFDPRTENAIS